MSTDYKTVFERTTAWIDVSFTDLDDAPAAPSALEYCLDCMSTSTSILAWTAVAGPTATTRIAITPAQNAIHASANESELHRLTLRATFGVGDQATSEYKFLVFNLGKVT